MQSSFPQPGCLPRLACRIWEENAACREAVSALEIGEIQLWLARVPSCETALAPLQALLDARERLRRDRLVDGGPRRRFVAGRALLRQLLGAWSGCDGACVRLEAGSGEKPRMVVLGEGTACHFNLAHAGEWVVSVLARECEVGVDLEGLDGVADFRSLAPAVCSPGEMRVLQAFPEPRRRLAFLRAWTRKEAVLKAAGTGLGLLSPAAVEVLPGDSGRELEIPDVDGCLRRWRVEDFLPPQGYCGAVAWELCQGRSTGKCPTGSGCGTRGR